MTVRRWLVVGAAASALAACGTARAPGADGNSGNAGNASNASVAAHVEEARQVAGGDLKPLLALCEPAPAVKPPQDESERGIARLMALPPPPAGKAFDDLAYVGARWVIAWALDTPDGIVLIDALDNEREAADVIEPGIRSVGWDPARIRAIVVTHGHGDHYGGAAYLARRTGAAIVMSRLDWTMTETRLEFETPLWSPPPQRDGARDRAVADGDSVELGGRSMKLYLTPGHTLGTLSPVFDVHEGGRSHRALLWGGTAFNFGRDMARLDAYIASTERMKQLAREQGIDVLLSNHAGYDGAIEKLAQLKTAAADGPNPFVIGNPAVLRALTVMGACAKAQRDRFALQG